MDWTLAQVRELVWSGLSEGRQLTCPACEQTVGMRRRSISGRQAAGLIRLAQVSAPGEYVHLTSILKTNDGEPSKLAGWGLIVEDNRKREDGGRAGFWAVTDAGRRWIRGEITVPMYTYWYNRRVLGTGGPQQTIEDRLGKKFDLRDL